MTTERPKLLDQRCPSVDYIPVPYPVLNRDRWSSCSA
jgi:hypothetical protein